MAADEPPVRLDQIPADDDLLTRAARGDVDDTQLGQVLQDLRDGAA